MPQSGNFLHSVGRRVARGAVGAIAPPPKKKKSKKKKKKGERERKKENKVACMREAAAFQPFPK